MVIIEPEITTAIWDLDGTLLNSFSILESLLHELAPQVGVQAPSRETLLRNFHGSLRGTFDNVFGDYLAKQGIDTLEQLFLSRQESYYDNLENHLLVDAVELSDRLAQHGIVQILVTNRNHKAHGRASPRSILERSSLGEHIKHIVCGDDSEFRKPDRRVVENLLGNLGVSGSEIVVIGDQHVDAQFALNLGSSAIIVARDGANFAHESLTHADWQQHITVVESLGQVQI